MSYPYTSEMRLCADACSKCHDACYEALPQCLARGGRYVHSAHLQILLDCEKLCDVNFDFLTRLSPMHVHTSIACAAVCDACAASCEQLAGEEMARCAQVCRACAQSCREISAQAL